MLQVSYICDVTHIAHLISEMLEQFHEHIISDARACMSEMCISVNCRTADIKSNVSFIDRLEDFLLPRKRIGYI